MCGFAGFFSPDGFTAPPEPAARAMAHAIRHRGPDDQGIWIDAAAGLALAHCRLSVIDLSAAGHQPMVSASGRYVIAFNGEIYNFAELRAELMADGSAPAWRGHSDTEVLLEAIGAWGLSTALHKAVGMFAFALWDRAERRLILARDRLGEKPLYYGWAGGVLLFGSELSALRQHPAFSGEIDRDALALMMRYNSVPAPHSIYRDIAKLRPGTFLVYDAKAGASAKEHEYWSAARVAQRGQRTPFNGSPEEALSETERLIKQSLGGQMVADVPLGAFLSGGIDSSCIVSIMQEVGSSPVKTFTIGFAEDGYDEAAHAHAVARHLGCDHHELYVSATEAMDVIAELPRIYCEPFADSSQIPTYLVAGLARKHVTVSLSGDGGDEVFSGYRRYGYAAGVWPKLSKVPRPLRAAAANIIKAIKPGTWDAIAGRGRQAGDRLHKAARVAALASPEEIYRALVSQWADPGALVIGANEPDATTDIPPALDAVRRMMLLDTQRYLPDDILVKVDRASMAVSLESRIPLLDHRLVEFASTLPLSILRRGGQSKWPLRQLVNKRIPAHLTERPKSGFAVPLDRWLKGPLRDWAESLLEPGLLAQQGYFNPQPIRDAWDQLQGGTAPLQEPIWNVLMFQAWLEANKSGKAPHTSATASASL